MSKEVRKYTDKQSLFLENLAGPAKGNIKEAMNLAGYAPDVSTTSVIKSLREEILEIAKDMLAGATIKSVLALDEVLENPAALGAKAKVSAAKELLDRAGIVKPPENSLGLNIPEGGLIILPAKRNQITNEVEPKVIEHDDEVIDV